MGKALLGANFVLLGVVIALSGWIVVRATHKELVPLSVKLQHDCMQAAFFLQGVGSPLPFSRWIASILPSTGVDNKSVFSIEVPSLQPNRTKQVVPIRLYAPSSPRVRHSTTRFQD